MSAGAVGAAPVGALRFDQWIVGEHRLLAVAVLVSLVMHVLCIALAPMPPPGAAARGGPSPAVTYLRAGSNAELEFEVEAGDPCLIALPREEAALAFPRRAWPAPAAAAAIEKVVSSPLRDQGRTGSAADLADALLAARSLVEARRAEAAAVYPAGARPATQVRVFGGVAGRVAELPEAPGPVAVDGPVGATEVRVMVGGDGRIMGAFVEGGSGNDALDSRALGLARRARFARGTAAEGLLVFFWGARPAGSEVGAAQ